MMRELDLVELTEDIPSEGLRRGDVGTIVVKHGPGAFEVEFSRKGGKYPGVLTLNKSQVQVVRHAVPAKSPRKHVASER